MCVGALGVTAHAIARSPLPKEEAIEQSLVVRDVPVHGAGLVAEGAVEVESCGAW